MTKIDKTLEKNTDKNYSQNTYMSMARIFSNIESRRRYFWYSSQLTNWVLDLGATCHMTPDISYFIPVSLMETDKYIEVANGNFVK